MMTESSPAPLSAARQIARLATGLRLDDIPEAVRTRA